ncbi:hypothetical protein D6C78_00392 [Aureobasidium pullulans]|uniref:Uncharacterized protein n=1 Tax=Aureobasidium pullulans TaxID=5580 RepID=A0A4V4LC01_AURPU|nr:hypothetical protein D6D28_00870 [Aureobasidium pullulans]THX12567.1 hypothetical protein D6D18_00426 [Aureobasidium pullulans]TIA26487.1 hypothetical protein D6C81_00748 [Aureobasidium pullulans]TIA43374.1 hypothetical protein D6C78_00392 [Aureobasidium pullulans]
MAPIPGAPRELLWYHQIQRENRHILERINKQQADMVNISGQLSINQRQAEQAQQILSELEAKQVTATERRREDFEQEKDILKRISELEDSVQALRRANDSQPVATGTTSQWQTLEQRLDTIENNQTTASDQDMQQLKLRMDELERGMTNTAGRSVGSVQQGAGERAIESVPEADLSVPGVAAGDQSRAGQAKDIATQESESECQSNERPSVPVQQIRRLGRERMPFRPTPPDLGW